MVAMHMQGEIIAQCSRYGAQPTAVAVLSTYIAVLRCWSSCLCTCGYALMLELPAGVLSAWVLSALMSGHVSMLAECGAVLAFVWACECASDGAVCYAVC